MGDKKPKVWMAEDVKLWQPWKNMHIRWHLSTSISKKKRYVPHLRQLRVPLPNDRDGECLMINTPMHDIDSSNPRPNHILVISIIFIITITTLKIRMNISLLSAPMALGDNVEPKETRIAPWSSFP